MEILRNVEGATASDTASDTGQRGEGLRRRDPFQSAYLSQEYEGALPVTMQLSLGTLQLEGMENAVTPEQATKLVTLWQALQSDSIQNTAERNAILTQIETIMMAEQMDAITAMQLTFEDMTAWAESSGIELPKGDVLVRKGGQAKDEGAVAP